MQKATPGHLQKRIQREWALVAALFAIIYLPAQTPVNGYARITAVAGTVLTVSNVSETYDTFEDGELVIVMQMQDDVIGANTGNNSSFGTLGAIQSAGLWEVARIASHTEIASLPATVTLTTALTNTYHTGVNARVQLISYPTLGSPNYSTSFDISSIAWNGTIGGVVVFQVNGTLTLNHNITADGAGFRGGSKNTPNSYTACDATTYCVALGPRYASKGEGIYVNTTAGFVAARGRLLNGGGGGNDVNAGGGGGGNYSAGGDGGIGWTPAGTGCSPGVGGLGGIPLVGNISGGRLFMGGGGGGGHENDGVGSAGGNGGGIILLKATSIISSGICVGRAISANGITPANAVNDGSGGGGAGGTILLNVSSYSITGTCPLVVSANGGNGGNSVTTGAHGGGGGGGQGAVIFSGAQPSTNVTTQTNAGTGGSSCIGCSASQNAANGAGPNNTGIFTGQNNPLPVELLYFNAKLNGNRVDLDWATASETENDYFVLERADAHLNATEIGQVDGAGTVTTNRSYDFIDRSPNPGINYYRLRQVDFNGQFSHSQWVAVEFKPEDQYVSVFPNPANTVLNVQLTGFRAEEVTVSVMDVTGRIVSSEIVLVEDHERTLSFDLSAQPAGVYFVTVTAAERQEVIRVVRY